MYLLPDLLDRKVKPLSFHFSPLFILWGEKKSNYINYIKVLAQKKVWLSCQPSTHNNRITMLSGHDWPEGGSTVLVHMSLKHCEETDQMKGRKLWYAYINHKKVVNQEHSWKFNLMKKGLNLNVLLFNKEWESYYNHSDEKNLQVNEKNRLEGSLVGNSSLSQKGLKRGMWKDLWDWQRIRSLAK